MYGSTSVTFTTVIVLDLAILCHCLFCFRHAIKQFRRIGPLALGLGTIAALSLGKRSAASLPRCPNFAAPVVLICAAPDALLFCSSKCLHFGRLRLALNNKFAVRPQNTLGWPDPKKTTFLSTPCCTLFEQCCQRYTHAFSSTNFVKGLVWHIGKVFVLFIRK